MTYNWILDFILYKLFMNAWWIIELINEISLEFDLAMGKIKRILFSIFLKLKINNNTKVLVKFVKNILKVLIFNFFLNLNFKIYAYKCTIVHVHKDTIKYRNTKVRRIAGAS